MGEDRVAEKTIGFIGLGDMGAPMVSNLLEGGFRVVSCANRRREAIEVLKEQGLHEVDDPHAVGLQSDILMTIVLDEKQTDLVLRGPGGALAAMKPGSVVFVMSTLAPEYCRALAKDAAELGITVLDCPVSGGPMGAEAGTLSLLIGGDGDAVESCRASLETMGRIFHCGDVGMGQIVKLANNGVLVLAAAALWEARNFIRAYGADVDTFMSILNQSTGRSFLSEELNKFAPPMWGHVVELWEKDAALCLEAAKNGDVNLPMLEKCRTLEWEVTKENFI
jgi:3-hydroxyisobutyrate dehydrogenase-like beta-hydroxyacid dehydrogenase